MNLNSQYELYPPQPDNPTDGDRHLLLKHALTEYGWGQDMATILGLMAPPKPVTDIVPPGSLKGVRVGVMGGGLAGLAAAYELRKTGCDVTVFDALPDRAGGRVYTFYFDDSPGAYGEFGPMRIPVSHETVWHYIRQFRLPTTPFIQTNPHGFVYLKQTRVRNDAAGANVIKYIYPKYELSPRERQTNWETLLNTGTADRLLRATTAERAEILRVLTHYRGRALEWINRTNISVMEAAGLTQGAIELVSNFVPLLEGNLYNSFIDYIQEVYPASVTYLYTIPGGVARLPAAFYQSFFSDEPYPGIPSSSLGKVTYRPGCLITGILLSDGGERVTLRYQSSGTPGGELDSFDYAVCALPFSTLRNVEIKPLFSGMKMRAVGEVHYTASQKTLLYFRERFWEKQGIAGGPSVTDLPIASVWYTNDHAASIADPSDIAAANLDTDAPGVIIGAFNFGLDTTRLLNQPDEVLLAEITREIAEVHGLPETYIRDSLLGWKAVNWNQEPTFRGAISFYAPSQKRLFSYAMTLPEYGGRVYFAGEHISAVHRWMQGALQTGMTAANELAAAAAGVMGAAHTR